MGALSHNGYRLTGIINFHLESVEDVQTFDTLRTCRCMRPELMKLLHTWDTKFGHAFDVTLF
jgi:hypothetical protein